MDNIFCKDCVYHKYHTDRSPTETHECAFVFKYKTTPYSKTRTRYNANLKNVNNDCKDFELRVAILSKLTSEIRKHLTKPKTEG